jgi:all-trans-retinol 13,14-reductase
MDMNHDVIIVGGGLGGLTAGALLAKSGKKVLLIEQHDKPGGCATTFKRKGYTVEVGLHEMDGLDREDIKSKIFRDLGVFDNVEFVEVPEFYRFTNGRIDIVIPADYERAITALVERFPEEERGIRRFFKLILDTRREINRLPRALWKRLLLYPVFPFLYHNVFFYQNRTVGRFLDSIIKNEDLKLVLLGNLTYYHDDPYTLSLLYYSVAQGSYYTGGGWYIKGGSQKLSDYLAKVITDNGGQVILNHLVTKIITKHRKAVGVEYRKKIPETSEISKAMADKIIANAAIPNVANDLLPANASRGLRSQINNLGIACSILSIYLGFKRPLRELGNRHYSTCVVHEGIHCQADLTKTLRGDIRNRPFIFIDYSQIDSGLAPEGKSLGVIAAVDYISEWENLGAAEYEARKEEVARIFIERLDAIVPGSKDAIDYCEVGTPKTIRRYTLNPEGTAYGFAQLPSQAGMKRVQHESSVENLYFSSAWTMPGGGFSGAIIGGYYCAEEILRAF